MNIIFLRILRITITSNKKNRHELTLISKLIYYNFLWIIIKKYGISKEIPCFSCDIEKNIKISRAKLHLNLDGNIINVSGIFNCPVLIDSKIKMLLSWHHVALITQNIFNRIEVFIRHQFHFHSKRVNSYHSIQIYTITQYKVKQINIQLYSFISIT